MKDKVGYLFFCQHCGTPQKIHDYILKTYFCSDMVVHYYCDNCEKANPIPDYVKKLKNEL